MSFLPVILNYISPHTCSKQYGSYGQEQQLSQSPPVLPLALLVVYIHSSEVQISWNISRIKLALYCSYKILRHLCHYIVS